MQRGNTFSCYSWTMCCYKFDKEGSSIHQQILLLTKIIILLISFHNQYKMESKLLIMEYGPLFSMEPYTTRYMLFSKTSSLPLLGLCLHGSFWLEYQDFAPFVTILHTCLTALIHISQIPNDFLQEAFPGLLNLFCCAPSILNPSQLTTFVYCPAVASF